MGEYDGSRRFGRGCLAKLMNFAGDLYTTPITDSGVAYLHRPEHLKILNLYDTPQVTDEATDALGRALPDLHVGRY